MMADGRTDRESEGRGLMVLKCVCVFLLAGMLICRVDAGQDAGNAGRSAIESRTRTEQAEALLRNAIVTVEYLKQTSGEIASPSDRVRVLLEIADSQWLVDPDQSRDTFKQGFEIADEFESSVRDSERNAGHGSLRNMVIARVARHDSALADKLASRVRIGSPEKEQEGEAFGQLYGTASARSEVLMEAATQLLDSAPQKAVELARLAASEGFTQHLRLFLLKLRAKDLSAADSLFELVFRAASARRPRQLIEALFVWDYAFQKKSIHLGSVGWFRESPAEYPASPELRRRALAFAVEALTQNIQDVNPATASDSEIPVSRERLVMIHSLGTQILPDVDAYMPSMSAFLQNELRRIEIDLSTGGRKLPTPPSPIPESPGTAEDADKLVERLVAQASKASTTSARDGLYARAVLRLYLHGEHDRALELSREIETRELLVMITEPIKFDRAGNLISRADLEKAAVVARSLETPELRVSVLARIGSAYLAAKKPNEALEILSEAEMAAAKAGPSVYLVSGLLGIALSMMEIDRDRAVSGTYAAVRTANGITDGDLWDLVYSGQGISGRLAVQNYSWSTRKDGGLESISVVYPRLAGLVNVLSKISERNFDEALLIAQQMKPKAQSIATQALICREAIKRAQTVKQSVKDGNREEDRK